jgi:hypothetical protein
MLASIPVNEMADTLRVLAGENAANAARHFTKRSYDMGDVSAAVLWSSIAQCLGAAVPAQADAPDADAAAADAVPIDRIREGIAMQGVWYEDIDAETLAREERTPISLAPIPQRARAPKRFGFVRTDAPAAGGGSERAPAPEIEFAQAA